MNKSISTPVDCSERGTQKLGMVSVAVLCCVVLCCVVLCCVGLLDQRREKGEEKGEGGREEIGGEKDREREGGREKRVVGRGLKQQ